jgi:hypothetical protein
MAIESWIDAHIHAFDYFGGVPHLLIPDNTKTAVTKARYYDPVLNKTYKEMADHYGAVIVPARSRKPTDYPEEYIMPRINIRKGKNSKLPQQNARFSRICKRNI